MTKQQLKYRDFGEKEWTDYTDTAKPLRQGTGSISVAYKIEPTDGSSAFVIKYLLVDPNSKVDACQQQSFKDSVKSVRSSPCNPQFIPYDGSGEVEIEGGKIRPAIKMAYGGNDLWKIVEYLSQQGYIEQPSNPQVTNILRGFACTTALNLLEGVRLRRNGDLLPPNVVVRNIETALADGRPESLEKVVAHLKNPKVRMIDYGMEPPFRMIMAKTQTITDYLGFFFTSLSDDKQDVYCALSIGIWLLSLAQKKLERKDLTRLAFFQKDDYERHFFGPDVEIVKKLVEYSRRDPGEIKSAEEVLNKIKELVFSNDSFANFQIKEEKRDVHGLDEQVSIYTFTRVVDEYGRKWQEKTTLGISDLEIASREYDELLSGSENEVRGITRKVIIQDPTEKKELGEIINQTVERYGENCSTRLAGIAADFQEKSKERTEKEAVKTGLTTERDQLKKELTKASNELDEFITSEGKAEQPNPPQAEDLNRYSGLTEQIEKVEGEIKPLSEGLETLTAQRNALEREQTQASTYRRV